MTSTSKTPLYLIAPSGAIADTNAAYKGIDWLSHNGFEVLNQDSINRKYQRFSGTDDQRLSDISRVSELVNQSKNETIAMSVRGGYGLSRILPHIDWQALSLAIDNGLTLVGHSDFTALSIALFAITGKYSLAGPMISPDFSSASISEITKISFQNAITQRSFIFETQESQQFVQSGFELKDCLLWGGNLTIINSLIGTPFFPNPTRISNGILFIEDVNEHPYRVERMLLQLIQAGVFNNQKAIILGHFSEYKLSPNDDGYNLDKSIEAIQKCLLDMKLEIPIFTGLPFGHVADKLTIPIGVNCSLTGDCNGFALTSNW